MKKFLLATASFIALGSVAAQAADIPARMPVKAPMMVTTVYNWTGPYVGINGGGGWGSGMSGGLLGGTFGYNVQAGSLVYGLEGDIDWSNIRGGGVRNSYLGTVRGRIGIAADRFMPYITGGLAYGDIQNSVGALSATTTKAGWTLGTGVEFAVAGPWTAKVEYLYANLGDGPTVAGVGSRFRSNTIRAGLNYRF